MLLKHKTIFIITLGLTFGCFTVSGSEMPEDLILSGYIRISLNQNADIRAAYDQWQVVKEEASAVKKLPNPVLRTGYFIENVETAVGPQEFKLGITQKIPMYGKLRSVSRAKMEKAKAFEHRYYQMQSDITAKVKSLYYDIYYLERATQITEQNVTLLENWEKVIQIKYQTAQVSHPDVIKTQIELIKLQNDLESLHARKRPLMSEFKDLLNDFSMDNITMTDSLYLSILFDTKESIKERVQNQNHALIALDHLTASAENQLKRAKMNYLPDFGVGVDYIETGDKLMDGVPVYDSGKDPLMFNVSLEIPIWFGKNAKQVSAARYKKSAAENKWVSQRNQMNTEIETILYQIEDAKRKIDLYGKDLIPKSMESLGASEKAYISDNTDLITLIDDQRRHLQFKLEYESAVVSYLQQKALLESYFGTGEGE